MTTIEISKGTTKKIQTAKSLIKERLSVSGVNGASGEEYQRIHSKSESAKSAAINSLVRELFGDGE